MCWFREKIVNPKYEEQCSKERIAILSNGLQSMERIAIQTKAEFYKVRKHRVEKSSLQSPRENFTILRMVIKVILFGKVVFPGFCFRSKQLGLPKKIPGKLVDKNNIYIFESLQNNFLKLRSSERGQFYSMLYNRMRINFSKR